MVDFFGSRGSSENGGSLTLIRLPIISIESLERECKSDSVLHKRQKISEGTPV